MQALPKKFENPTFSENRIASLSGDPTSAGLTGKSFCCRWWFCPQPELSCPGLIPDQKIENSFMNPLAKIVLSKQNRERLRNLAKRPTKSSYQESSTVRRLHRLRGMVGRKTCRYLEIGVEKGETFEAVAECVKVGVDPEPLFRESSLPRGASFYKTTSNDFFAAYRGAPFDLVYVDGLHEAFQTYADVINSLNNLAQGGYVLLDDVWPSDFPSSIPDTAKAHYEKKHHGITHRRWYGDVYKALYALHNLHAELSIQVIGNGADSHSQAVIWRNRPSNGIAFSPLAEGVMDDVAFDDCFGSHPAAPWQFFVDEDSFLDQEEDRRVKLVAF